MPCRTTYRAVYVAFPVDDNYGDLMLLNCRWLGLCHQVYRGSTDTAKTWRCRIQQAAVLLGRLHAW